MNTKTYLSISDFTRMVKRNLESSFTEVFLKGEISNFRPASSGHWYFVLKDAGASIKAIIFKNAQAAVFNVLRSNNLSRLEDGQQVLVEGRISLYERSGEYSIIINKVIPAGVGELTIKFQLLKEKLAKEGLFNQEIKQPLPKFPTHIGIITSPTAAALQDILNVLNRRFSSVKITVFPAGVQGENAKHEIVKAIECANLHARNNTRYKTDALILARGGGSIEDLWPFNEEVVAYAIHKSQLPIITGVGHEIDYTIADFCSDYRAPTPSAAAEIVVKSSEDLINTIAAHKLRIEMVFNNYLEKLHTRYNYCNKDKLLTLFERIYQKKSQDYSYITEKMSTIFYDHYNNMKNVFKFLIQKLEDLSPLKTLGRGYSLVFDDDKNLIKSYSQAAVDDALTVQLSEGNLRVKVTETNEGDLYDTIKN